MDTGSSEGEPGQAGNQGQDEKQGKTADDPSGDAHPSLPAKPAVRTVAAPLFILQLSQLGRRALHGGSTPDREGRRDI